MSQRYFSGSIQVDHAHVQASPWLKSSGAARAYGSFYWVGFVNGLAVPVDRVIDFKRGASLHVCDVRCQSARGHVCECSCGGLNHGRGVAAVTGQGGLF